MFVGERGQKLRGLQSTTADLFDEIDVRKNRSAGMLVGIQHPHLLFQMPAHQFYWFEKVGVVRYHDTDIKSSQMGIVQ